MNVNVDNLKKVIKSSMTTGIPVLLTGKPGIGKTEVISQASKKIQDETGKKIYLKTIYLNSTLLEQLTGVPNTNGTWIKPEILSGLEPADIYVFLFDDIHLADRNKQGLLFQILTHKTINGHKFPENSVFILAGNGTEDNAGAHVMLAPVINRVAKFTVEPDFVSWKNYVTKYNYNKAAEIIISFLEHEENTSFFHYYNETMENEPFASPRSWFNLIKSLDFELKTDENLLENREYFLELAKAFVGEKVAHKLLEYVIIFIRFKDLNDFLNINSKKITTIETYVATNASTKFMVQNKDNPEIKNKILEKIFEFHPTYIVLFLKKLIDNTINKDKELKLVKEVLDVIPENLKDKVAEIFNLLKK